MLHREVKMYGKSGNKKIKFCRIIKKMRTIYEVFGKKPTKDSELPLRTSNTISPYPSYEEVFTSSVDSGVIIPKPNLKFSKTHIERRKSSYFNSTKCMEHSTKSTVILHSTNGEEVVNNNVVEVEVHPIPEKKLIEDKFVVNLFESRKSTKVENFDKIECIKDVEDNENNNNSDKYSLHCIVKQYEENSTNHQSDKTDLTIEYSKPYQEIDSDALFYKLRKLRDIECVKMNQASNALNALKSKSNAHWSEELLAEKILLETDLRYKLIVQQIRKVITEPELTKPVSKGALTLSNFRFEVNPDNNQKDFYVLTISHDTEVLVTKPVRGEDYFLNFPEVFNLKNVGDDFQIKIEVFRKRFDAGKRWFLPKIINKKKPNSCCPMFKIYYENVHTCELHESKILKSSFISCGNTILTRNNLSDTSFTLNLPETSPLKPIFDATLTVPEIDLNHEMSGFLNLGKPDQDNNVVFWERKWCSLKKNKFSIYNYPQDEDLGKIPEYSIDLQYCFSPLIKESKNCPKRKSFVIKTGKPSTMNGNESGIITLKKKNNFVLEKFYLSADNREDFEKWTECIDDVLDCLMSWNKLVFADDYYLTR